MLQIYGSPRTSAGRCYLMLEEVGAPYTAIALDMFEKKEHKAPAYLKLNPNGKVPCLVDGDFMVWESLAINLYLAEKYKPELLGSSPQDRALIEQWNLWGMLELQTPMIEVFIQLFFVKDDERDQTVIDENRAKVPPLLAILDSALADRKYILGEKISLADLNLATVANTAVALKFELEKYPNLSAWFNRVKERPSFQKFLSLRTPKS